MEIYQIISHSGEKVQSIDTHNSLAAVGRPRMGQPNKARLLRYNRLKTQNI